MSRHLALALAATGTWRERMYAAPTANVAKRSVSISPSGQVELVGGDGATVLQETWELELTSSSLDAILAEPDTTLAVLQEAFAGELMIAPSYIAIQTTPALEHTHPMGEESGGEESSAIQMSFAEAADRAKSWEKHLEAEGKSDSALHNGRGQELRTAKEAPANIIEEFPPNFPAPKRAVQGCHCQWDNRNGGECQPDPTGILKSMGVSPGITSPSELSSKKGQKAYTSRFVAAEALCQSIGKDQAEQPTAGDCAQCSGRSQCNEAWKLAHNEQISGQGVVGACSKDNELNSEHCSSQCLDAFGCFLEACEGNVLETRVGENDVRTDFSDRHQVENFLKNVAQSSEYPGSTIALAESCRPHFERATMLERNVASHTCSRWVDGVFSVFMESENLAREPEENADVRTLTIEFDISIPEKEDPERLESALGAFNIEETIDRIEKSLADEGVQIDEIIGWKELTRGGTGGDSVEAKSGGDDVNDDEPKKTTAKKGEGNMQVILGVVGVVLFCATGFGVYKLMHMKDTEYEVEYEGEEEEEEEYEEE